MYFLMQTPDGEKVGRLIKREGTVVIVAGGAAIREKWFSNPSRVHRAIKGAIAAGEKDQDRLTALFDSFPQVDE